MRAVVLRAHGGPEVLRLETLPDPVPGPGEVLVRVRAAALNHLDLWMRRGLPGAPFHLPRIPGSDVAGEVAALGPGVEDPPVGTPVMVIPGLSCGSCAACGRGADQLCPSYGILGETADGGMCELLAVPRRNVVKRPDRLSYEEAAALGLTFLTAWHMLTARATVRPGETVLVIAASSGVGSAAVQIARFLGARVLATAGSEAKRDFARSLGAHEVIDHTTGDFAPTVKSLTGGQGADVVFEHVGGTVFEQAVRCLARAGRLVTCGATTGGDAKLNLRHLFFKSQSILGSTMGSRGEYHDLVKLFGDGHFRASIDRVLPLDAIQEAHRLLEGRRVLGKLVVVP
jgi:NADPH:quinone reductase-like Zn-dependent oxidoreductase